MAFAAATVAASPLPPNDTDSMAGRVVGRELLRDRAEPRDASVVEACMSVWVVEEGWSGASLFVSCVCMSVSV